MHLIIYHLHDEATARTCSDHSIAHKLAMGYIEAVPVWNGVAVHPLFFVPSYVFKLALTLSPHSISASVPLQLLPSRLRHKPPLLHQLKLPHLDVLLLNVDLFEIAQFVVDFLLLFRTPPPQLLCNFLV